MDLTQQGEWHQVKTMTALTGRNIAIAKYAHPHSHTHAHAHAHAHAHVYAHVHCNDFYSMLIA